ncbi:MAG: HU family DNA-binding protein [Balneolaceae bacterium]
MSNKATYNDIIEALSQSTGISKRKSDDFAKGLIKLVKEDLKTTGKSSITNFGGFSVKDVAEREGRNPQTGEAIRISARKRVSFSPYKALKKRVNAPYEHLEPKLIETETETEAGPDPKPETKVERPTFNPPKKSQSGVLIVSALIFLIISITAAWFFMSSDTEATETVAETAISSQETSQIDIGGSEEEAASVADSEDETDGSTMDSTPEAPVEASVETTAEAPDKTSPVASENYDVQHNEWFWVISKKVYGKSEWWPLIYQGNQYLNEDPDQLLPRKSLKIPALKGTAENPAKEDYRRLAIAASFVSKAYIKYNKPEKAAEYARFAKKYEKQGK